MAIYLPLLGGSALITDPGSTHEIDKAVCACPSDPPLSFVRSYELSKTLPMRGMARSYSMSPALCQTECMIK